MSTESQIIHLAIYPQYFRHTESFITEKRHSNTANVARPVSTSMNDVGFRNISESAADLCKTLAKLACLVATNDLEAELVAYNFYCLIFSDKNHGVRPIGVREVLRRTIDRDRLGVDWKNFVSARNAVLSIIHSYRPKGKLKN